MPRHSETGQQESNYDRALDPPARAEVKHRRPCPMLWSWQACSASGLDPVICAVSIGQSILFNYFAGVGLVQGITLHTITFIHGPRRFSNLGFMTAVWKWSKFCCHSNEGCWGEHIDPRERKYHDAEGKCPPWNLSWVTSKWRLHWRHIYA